jgi:hypothetical protein
MQAQANRLPPPPRLIPILANGFNVVANHITLVLLPVLLDMYLWLGPRLGLKELYLDFMSHFPLVAQAGGPSLSDIQAIREQLATLFERFNLLTLLRTFPVGVTSLMLGWQPIGSPVGDPMIIETSSILSIMGWLVFIILLGWILGSLYFHWISKVTLQLEPRPTLHTTFQTILLSLLLVVAVIAIGFPAIWLYMLVALISPMLGQALFFLIGMLSLWMALPIFFAPHGIYINRQNALASVLSSLRMMRYTLPSSGLFMAGLFIISQGLGYLWRVPQQNSWWVLVSIVGHAFVSTGLMAASFIYYREINAWLKAVFEQLSMQPTSTRV